MLVIVFFSRLLQNKSNPIKIKSNQNSLLQKKHHNNFSKIEFLV